MVEPRSATASGRSGGLSRLSNRALLEAGGAFAGGGFLGGAYFGIVGAIIGSLLGSVLTLLLISRESR